MINLGQLREYVIQPALQRIGKWSQSAENLVFGTGLVESGYTYLDQSTPGPGPAYGFWQMEEPTHFDLWANFLPGQPAALRETLLVMAGAGVALSPPVEVLHGNLFYAAAMCRVRYLPARPALPAADDFAGMADYWLRFYNRGGKGTIERALPYFKQAVYP
jgi:hypothetical protein